MVAPSELLAPPTEQELAESDPLLAPPSEQELREAEAEQAGAAGVFGEAALSGATAGLSDPAIATSRAEARAIDIATSEGLTPGSPKFGPNPEFEARVSELTQQFLPEESAKIEAERAASPVAAATGEIAGALSPVGPGAALFRGGAALARGAAGAAPGLSRVAGTGVGRAALTGAGGGAAFAAGQEAAQELGGLEGEAGDIAGAAGAGAGISAGLAAVPVVGRGVGLAARAGLAATFGVKQKAITKFLDNADRIKAAPSKEVLKDSVQKAVDDIQREASEAQLDLVDLSQEALVGLKSKLVQESDDALGILERSNAKLSKQDLVSAADAAKKNLFVAGKAPVGEAAKGAVKKIESFKRGLEVLPDDLSAIDMKSIIKQIDDDVNFLQTPGTFDDNLGQRALKGIRREIDQKLKSQVPAYAQQMERVADQAQFLSEASKKLGGQDKALSAVRNLGKPGREIKDETLKRLAQESGVDLDRFRRAQENAQLFKTWQGQSVEGKINNLMSERSIEIKRLFERLGKMSGDDFIQAADDLAVRNQFEQEFLRGSRNVNLWTIVGASIGGVGGGFILSAAGAAFGATIDKHGPKMAQKILEQVAKIRGLPTVEKIRKLDLPDNVKDELTGDFTRAFLVGTKSDEPVPIPNALRPAIQREIVVSDHLTDLEKANMLSEINRKGEAKNLDKFMASGAKPPAPQPNAFVRSRKPKQPAVNIQDAAEFIRTQRPKDF